MMWRLLLTLALLCGSSEGEISCKNEEGAAVDWYILYKLPQSLQYIYIDSLKNEYGKKDINAGSALKKTLQPILIKMPTCGFVAYNDQPPPSALKKSARDQCGHSKGVVMMDESNVVWLLHSTPKFPVLQVKGQDFFPQSGEQYAQTFICATFPQGESSKIEEHLQLIRANIFAFANPELLKFSVDITTFYKGWKSDLDLTNKKKFYRDLKTRANQKFKSFYKKISEAPEDGDLYFTIAKELKTDLYAQTWGGQKNRADSYCPKTNKVFNINTLAYDYVTWKSSSDHSKWCVSKDGEWTCISDSNRANTQFSRPGGALCIENKHVNEAFNKLMQDYEVCKDERSRTHSTDPSPRKIPRLI